MFCQPKLVSFLYPTASALLISLAICELGKLRQFANFFVYPIYFSADAQEKNSKIICPQVFGASQPDTCR